MDWYCWWCVLCLRWLGATSSRGAWPGCWSQQPHDGAGSVTHLVTPGCVRCREVRTDRSGTPDHRKLDRAAPCSVPGSAGLPQGREPPRLVGLVTGCCGGRRGVQAMSGSGVSLSTRVPDYHRHAPYTPSNTRNPKDRRIILFSRFPLRMRGEARRRHCASPRSACPLCDADQSQFVGAAEGDESGVHIRRALGCTRAAHPEASGRTPLPDRTLPLSFASWRTCRWSINGRINTGNVLCRY